MLSKDKIDRINVLANKCKAQGLTPEELQEQKELRAEYIVKFRENFKGHLESIKFVEDLDVEKNKEKN